MQQRRRKRSKGAEHRVVCLSGLPLTKTDATPRGLHAGVPPCTNQHGGPALPGATQPGMRVICLGGSMRRFPAAGQTNSLGIGAPDQEQAAPPQALTVASWMRHRSLVCKKMPPSLAQKWLGWSACRQLPSRHLRLPLLGASLRSGHPPAAGGLAHRPPCLLRQLLHRQHSSSSAGQRARLLVHAQLCGRPHEVPKLAACLVVNDYLCIVAQQDSGWSKCAECSSRASRGQNEQKHARGKLRTQQKQTVGSISAHVHTCLVGCRLLVTASAS